MPLRCGHCREQQQWVAERLENRQSPSTAQSLRTLRTLVHADEFEAFLAEHFPHSKVGPCGNVSVGLLDAFIAFLGYESMSSLWTRRLHTLLAVCFASLQQHVFSPQLTVQA